MCLIVSWVTAETALGALILILAGFVFIGTQEWLVPSARRDFSKSAVEFFGYGGINFVVFSWAIVPRIQDWSSLSFSGWDYVLTPVVSIVAPFLAAILWVRLSHSNTLEKLSGMGAGRRTPEPAAWDAPAPTCSCTASSSSWLVPSSLPA